METSQGNRRRSHSDNWWKEEIVDETDDKEDAMESYYGLSKKDKEDFYGKSKNPFEDEVNRYGHTSFHVNKSRLYNGGVAIGIGYNTDGSIESALVEIEQEKDPASQSKGLICDNDPANVDSRHASQAQRNVNNGNYSFYQQASQMRNSGYYQDDYSFSVINIPKDTDVTQPEMKKINKNNTILQMPKWFSGFAPGVTKESNNKNYAFPNMTSETNIAPPIRGSNQEWWATSPKVTFDTEYGQKKSSNWSRLSPHQKIGIGVTWVALMCIIVTISELKNSENTAPNEDGRSSGAMGLLPVVDSQTVVPTVSLPGNPTKSPTSLPTSHLTLLPTLHPTSGPKRSPITHAPIAGYSAIHGKHSDGTPRPTRSPVTSLPTRSSTPNPTKPPTLAPTAQQLVQAAPSTTDDECTDDHGDYLNHLDNLKDCAWLENGKPGFTDRKEKNCGTKEYHMTELGAHCRATCALYNECGASVSLTVVTGSFLTPAPANMEPTTVKICDDRPGMYKNHLNNLKDCSWLSNDKPGQTDRKDKNCGYAQYSITELGMNCPVTCSWYNGDGCSFIEVMPSSGGSKLRSSEFSSSTECVNGSGVYLDHKLHLRTCQWLHGENTENSVSRLEKNCGTDKHPISELGIECPWSCQDYNGCNQK